MNRCPRCGAELKNGAAFCTECGQRIAPPAKKKSKNGVAIAVAAVMVVVLMFALFGKTESDNSTSAVNDGATTTVTDAATVQTEQTKPPITEEEYKAECVEVGYKDLCRYPENYIGTKICLTVEIAQIMDASLIGSQKAWRCYTDNSGYGFYADDEYYILDKRDEGAIKILDEDVVTVYGEFTGLVEVKRALGGTTDELPCIEARYADLIEEDE